MTGCFDDCRQWNQVAETLSDGCVLLFYFDTDVVEIQYCCWENNVLKLSIVAGRIM
ncbi:hypothetical protein Patl1_27086 [Pistacia atlantica]|uniref:Uncharacterized protein n=1 Tax=Pistacia atlantica TaxID=434234 RepID=A0ACC1B0F0_9ROSI|nr:hypothetical protein Patl1_27086 [Pistacia atlantica]